MFANSTEKAGNSCFFHSVFENFLSCAVRKMPEASFHFPCRDFFFVLSCIHKVSAVQGRVPAFFCPATERIYS
ncbi:MAG TPA: hypothetical protein DCS74_01240 [Veillonellaceae bacterium]|nr:hypothetical protein [Veillonellaceae bacterium]